MAGPGVFLCAYPAAVRAGRLDRGSDRREGAMSRRVYLLGVGLALVALAFILTDALLWQPGVIDANVRRIRQGMKLEDVEAILGPHHSYYEEGNGFGIYGWRCKTGSAEVHIDFAERVI